MAFGIGVNAKGKEEAPVRGRQREIACQCWFTSKGEITPLMLKMRDENGEIKTVRQIQVLFREEKLYAGVPSVEFGCILTLLERRIAVKLIYYKEENRWMLVCQ